MKVLQTYSIDHDLLLQFNKLVDSKKRSATVNSLISNFVEKKQIEQKKKK